MGINVQPSTSFPINVQSNFRTNVTPAAGGDVSAYGGDAHEAYVSRIDPASAAHSLASPDAPLSEVELRQLFKVYINLGGKNDLWKEIGALLTEFTGQDRVNFLSVLARAGEHTGDIIRQVNGLDSENRSAYLRTAVRLDPDTGLAHMIQSVKHLDQDAVSRFLSVADSLGRSRNSLKADELENFMAAAANSPEAIEGLIRKTAELNEEQRALFLQAAASAGDDLNRLIGTLDSLTENELGTFLNAAAKAGKGLANLLDLTRDLDARGRLEILSFIEALNEKETTDFLIATRGIKTDATLVMETAYGMDETERQTFLGISASAGDNLDRFISMVNLLSPETGERADFLSAAATAGERLTHVLSLAETLDFRDREGVLSFLSGLGLADLSSFLTAANGNTAQAVTLAETADALEGKDKSYLLYASSVASDSIPELTTLARDLDGAERSDFLFAAANSENADSLEELASGTSERSGRERREFLAGIKEAYQGGEAEALAREYVFLKSAFSDSEFSALINAGPDGIEDLVTEIETMAFGQREAFFSLVEAAGTEEMHGLISVTARLDEARIRDLTDLAFSLGQEDRKHLIAAADLALNRFGGALGTFDRLIGTAERLPPGSAGYFIHAAAGSGNALETLMDQTELFYGANRAYFLIAADTAAGLDDDGQMLNTLLAATDHILNKTLGNILDLKETPGGILPSRIINANGGTFNANAKPGDVSLPAYLESAAFMASRNTADYRLKMTWYQTFMKETSLV